MHKNLLIKILVSFFTIVSCSQAMEEPPRTTQENNDNPESSIGEILPIEMWGKILEHLSPEEALNLGYTEKYFFNSSFFWKMALKMHFSKKFEELNEQQRKDAKYIRELFYKLTNVPTIFHTTEDGVLNYVKLYEEIKSDQFHLSTFDNDDEFFGRLTVFQAPLIGPDGFIYVFIRYPGIPEGQTIQRVNRFLRDNPLPELCVVDPFNKKVIKRIPLSNAIQNALIQQNARQEQGKNQDIWGAMFGSDGRLYFSTKYSTSHDSTMRIWSLNIDFLTDSTTPTLKHIATIPQIDVHNNSSFFFRGENNSIYHSDGKIERLTQIKPIAKHIHFTQDGEINFEQNPEGYKDKNSPNFFPILQDKQFIHSLHLSGQAFITYDLNRKKVLMAYDVSFPFPPLHLGAFRSHSYLKSVIRAESKIYITDLQSNQNRYEGYKLSIFDEATKVKLGEIPFNDPIMHFLGMYKDSQGLINILFQKHLYVLDPRKSENVEIAEEFRTINPIDIYSDNFVVHRPLASNEAKLRKFRAAKPQSSFMDRIDPLQEKVNNLIKKMDRTQEDLEQMKARLKRQAATIIYLTDLNKNFQARGWFESNDKPRTFTPESLQACTKFAKQLAEFARLDNSQHTALTPKRIVESIEEITAAYYVDFPNPDYFKMEDNEFSIGQRAVLFNIVTKYLQNDLDQNDIDQLSRQLKQGLQEKAPRSIQGDFDGFWQRTNFAAQHLITHYDVPEDIAAQVG